MLKNRFYLEADNIAVWVNDWLKNKTSYERLPGLFEVGASSLGVTVNRDVARELYREQILLENWKLLADYADFIKPDEGAVEGVVSRDLLKKNLAILGWRLSPDRPEALYNFERLDCEEAFGEKSNLFEQVKENVYVGEKEKHFSKARSLYLKGKEANNDKKKIKLFLKSALLGYLPSYSELGSAYDRSGNSAECIKWHEEGSKSGLEESCLYFADLYAGSERECEYLSKCYLNATISPSTLLRYAQAIENQLLSESIVLSVDEAREKEELLYNILARVIYENSDCAGDFKEDAKLYDDPLAIARTAKEINEARVMLARLILENRIKGDGVLAIVLLGIAKLREISIDDSLLALAESYKINEREKIRSSLKNEMQAVLAMIKDESAKRVEKNKAFDEKKKEQERLAHEEKERLENERKEKELREFIVEARKYADKDREKKRLAWSRPLDLGRTAEYAQLKTETKEAHDKAVALYQEALDTYVEEKALRALRASAEAGHPRAISELAKYYHGYDEKTAQYWLEACAKQGNLNNVLTDKWEWSLKHCLTYARSQNADIRHSAMTALAKLEIKSMTADEEAELKALADSPSAIAIRVYGKYIKKTDPSEYERCIYRGATLGDRACVQSYIEMKGEVNEDSPSEYISLLQNEDLKEFSCVKFEWYRIYQSERLSKLFGVRPDLKKAYKILSSISTQIPESDFRKKVRLEMARCAENGLGREVDLWLASVCYEGYDDRKSQSLLEQHNTKLEMARREKEAERLMEKYPSADLNGLLKTDSAWANNIILKYKSTAPDALEEQMKARDKYLRFGFTLADMYSPDGTFKEHQIQSAYIKKKREQEEKAKKEAKEKARLKKLEEDNARLQKEQNDHKATPSPKGAPEPLTNKTAQNTKKTQEETAISAVRQKYGYNPNGSYDDHLEYFFRMCEGAKSIPGKTSLAYNCELAEKLGVARESVVNICEFESILKEKIDKVVGCFPGVHIKGEVSFTRNYHRYAERRMADLPVRGGALNIEVNFLQDIARTSLTPATTSENWFYEEYTKFHNHEISKFVDYNEYADKTGLNYELYNLRSSEIWSAKDAARKATRAIAKELLKHYTVVCPTLVGTRKGLKKHYMLIHLIATDAKITFSFLGNYITT